MFRKNTEKLLVIFFFAFSCKEVTHVFGENHQLLENVEKLGSVPLEVEIMRNSDKGTPFVVTHPKSKVTEVYLNIGQKLLSKFLSPND
jgi:MinD-like ATPase involved in chromosome partitioning or flagellar assembly